MAVVPYAAIRHLKAGQALSKKEVRLLLTTKAVRHVAVRLAPRTGS